MKLTQAQIKVLQAVAKGEVELYDSPNMRKPIKIYGANKGVVVRLTNAKLIKTIPTEYFSTKKFILTEEGRKVVESQCSS